MGRLTRNSREGKKGELKVGEYADFILLSDDLTNIPPSQYTKVRVLRAVVGGTTLYQTNGNSTTVIGEAGFFFRKGLFLSTSGITTKRPGIPVLLPLGLNQPLQRRG